MPGGRLIVAVNHPFVYKLQYPDADYFAPREYSEEYTFSGQNATFAEVFDDPSRTTFLCFLFFVLEAA